MHQFDYILDDYGSHQPGNHVAVTTDRIIHQFLQASARYLGLSSDLAGGEVEPAGDKEPESNG